MNKAKKEKAINSKLVEYLQTQGGITFKEPSYIITGDGYVKVIHIYKMAKQIEEFWLSKLFNIENTIATIDVATKNMAEVRKNIKNAINEERSRQEQAGRNAVAEVEAGNRERDLTQLVFDLTNTNELIKIVDFRIFVAGKTLHELDKRVEEIIKDLEGSGGYMGAVMLNEQKRDWQSLQEPYHKQIEKPFSLKGHPLTTLQLAMGDPFNYSELLDDTGVLLGFTETNGSIVFDPFFNDGKKRISYNGGIMGGMGNGKSTTMKKLFKHQASIGNFVRTFDVSGEFSPLTLEFGGKIIRCNGSEGKLNPLEILEAGDDEKTNYTKHIAKITTFYSILQEEKAEIVTFRNYLRKFYEKLELVPKDKKKITGRKAEEYPTFSEFLNFLYEEMDELEKIIPDNPAETKVVEDNASNLNILIHQITDIVNNYGQLFDGHTTIDNIIDEKIVTFNLEDIKSLGNAFHAQLFNMLSLCWDNAVQNGKPLMEKYNRGEIEDKDITKFFMLIDESHEWINANNPIIVDIVLQYFRESRKYFAGIFLASQSISDFVPGEVSSKNFAKNAENIKTLFELMQYKIVMSQDTSALEKIESVFGKTFSAYQLEDIPALEKGDCYLVSQGNNPIKFNVWLSESYEESIFAGGK